MSAQRWGKPDLLIKFRNERAFAVCVDCSIDGRAGAEQESSYLSRRTASSRKQEDVQSEQIAESSATKLRKHEFLLVHRNIEYGRIGHSSVSLISRVLANNEISKSTCLCQSHML
jgi:hypothetical protein